MTDTPLPANVYRLEQKDFDAIPGSPWVYWISNKLRTLFLEMCHLGDLAEPKQGLATADNGRFLRFWWEVGYNKVSFKNRSRKDALKSEKRWFPCMKGGMNKKWFGNQEFVINWMNDGKELQSFEYAFIRNQDTYFCEGLTFTDLTSTHLSIRWMPIGFIYDHAGNAFFQNQGNIWSWLSLLNSQVFSHLIQINPTIHFYIGDFKRMPIPKDAIASSRLALIAQKATRIRIQEAKQNEKTFDFIAPPLWLIGIPNRLFVEAKLKTLQEEIDSEVYSCYGINLEDRISIETDLIGELVDEESSNKKPPEEIGEIKETILTSEELALSWISYAVGIVLGRFQPGVLGSLGRAIYHQADFAIGSLPAPDEAEFDELVGPAERFAWVDEHGGRHVFSQPVEQALQALALPDGIAVLDAGHPRDLATLTLRALELMLGEQQAREVIDVAVGEAASAPIDRLRKFLEKDFFTNWHMKWYRKRPVYWPVQSSKRAYGFVLFHEKIGWDTFYTLQREPYLDTKRRAVVLQITDLQREVKLLNGAARKRKEKELDELNRLADELAAFAKELEAITRGGYEPESDWIDDGVILRMAPLWPVLPVWKSEPKKHWERLAAGDFDWSHIAMKYWPERVREKCKTNKSFAIAHGHEEWYEGR
jgi:hypothetical protein